MNSIKLDVKNRRILQQLEIDCRQPITQVAKKVGVSREVVTYRIRRLEEEKVIERYITIIDYVRLGLMFCRIFCRYNHVSNEIEQQIVRFLKKQSHLAWIVLGDGDVNLALVYLVRNINILQDAYYRFLLEFGRYLKNHLLSINFQILHFQHSYLYPDKDRASRIVGANKEVIRLDALDRQLLYALMKDPKISLVDLSRRLELSVKTINKRMQSLKKEKVILGFKAKINTHKLNLEHYKVFLYLENSTKQKLNLIIAYLSQSDEVIFITVPMGNADLEFEVVLEGKVQLFEYMRNLIINFPRMIKEYESALLYEEPMTNYLPQIDCA